MNRNQCKVDNKLLQVTDIRKRVSHLIFNRRRRKSLFVVNIKTSKTITSAAVCRLDKTDKFLVGRKRNRQKRQIVTGVWGNIDATDEFNYMRQLFDLNNNAILHRVQSLGWP